tara:strand:- start:1453 stop:2742 length:1290 start_codon:yes stop_codon:yes gene_type:complete
MTTAQRWRIALWLTMIVGVLYVFYGARGALLPFAIGALFAYALSPIVDHIANIVPIRSHRGDVLRRGFAVIIIYLLLGAAAFFAGSAFIPIAVDQVSEFFDTLPATIETAQIQVNSWLEQYRNRVPIDLQERIDARLQDAGNTAINAATSMVQRSIGMMSSTIAIVISFAVMPFWMFYAMRDRHFVKRNFLAAVPSALRDDAINLLHISDRLLGRYIRAQLLLAVIVGTMVGVSLTLLGIPLSLALGVIAGITELIPIVGPWIGAVPGLILVAAIDPDKFIWVALVYFLVQQFENLFLVPRIQGEALEMHPAMILLVLSLGGAAFGFIGLIIAVPVSALLREMFWYLDHRLKGDSPEIALLTSHIGSSNGIDNQISIEDPLRAPQKHSLPSEYSDTDSSVKPVASQNSDTGTGTEESKTMENVEADLEH